MLSHTHVIVQLGEDKFITDRVLQYDHLFVAVQQCIASLNPAEVAPASLPEEAHWCPCSRV